MHLFIWNDRRWQLIDKNTPYDKENYVVIRKLRVRWRQADTKNILSAIQKEFQKFGEIVTVEYATEFEERAVSDEHEMYVSYIRSEDAYNAFIENREKIKSCEQIVHVLPVDTWHINPFRTKSAEMTALSQRIESVDYDDDSTFVYDMQITPGCLLKIFRSFLRISKGFLTGLDIAFDIDDEIVCSEDESDSDDSDCGSQVSSDAECDSTNISSNTTKPVSPYWPSSDTVNPNKKTSSKDDKPSKKANETSTKVDISSGKVDKPSSVDKLVEKADRLIEKYKSGANVEKSDSQSSKWVIEVEEVKTETSTETSIMVIQTDVEVSSDSDSEQQTNIMEDVEDENCIETHEFEKRVAEVMVENIGVKFDRLTLRKLIISADFLKSIAPVLRKCKKLELHLAIDTHILYQLRVLCPNLTHLNLHCDEVESDFVNSVVVSWPSLTDLFVKTTPFEKCHQDQEDKLQQFIEENPQIKSLQLEVPINIEILATIERNLADLHTFAFRRFGFDNLNKVLDHVAGGSCGGLKMSVMEVNKNDLNGLAKCAKRLGKMHSTRLISIFLNCVPETEEYEHYSHLHEFSVTQHFNCECHDAPRLIQYNDNFVEIPEDDVVLALFVNTIDPHKSKDKTLQASITNAFKKVTKFFPNVVENKMDILENSALFIHVSSCP